MTRATRLRQVGAFTTLLVRHWLRAGMAGARIERFRKGSAFVVRLVSVAIYAGLGRMFGLASIRGAASGLASVEWLVASIVGFAACWGMLTRGLALRGMTMPLTAPFIDTLPVNDGARTTVELFEVALAHVVSVSAFLNAAPALPVATAAALGLGTSLTASIVGTALMRWIFVLAPPERALSATQFAVIAQILFIAVAFGVQNEFSTIRLSFFSPIARPIAGEGGLAEAFTFLGTAAGLAIASIVAAERVGYDRVEVVPRKRLKRAHDEELNVGPLDDLLSRREPGSRRWPFVFFSALVLAGFGFAVVALGGRIPVVLGTIIPQALVGYVAWMVFPIAATVATRAVTRDLVARPLLSALPLEPRQLLDGKIAVVRQRMIIGLFPLALALLAPIPKDVWLRIAWRSAAVGAGAWMYASASVSVAFLTGGAQTARPQPGGTFRLETMLLLAPLAGLLFAASPWLTLVPLASLALVAFEAKRAAMRVVRWLDDGEDFERETPEWRAALAFAAFQGSQVLAARLISAWTSDAGIVMGSSYAVSGIVLVGLTAYGRRDLAPLRIWPRNPAFVAVAVAAGIGTSTLGRLVVHRFLIHDVDTSNLELSRAGGLAFILTAGTLAPVVEEIFFRGWLQHVIDLDLDAKKKWLAPVIAALAFASVHPPASFPAVFSLGLVVGALYARTSSLAPCVAAHAAHNWVATLWQ